MTSIKSYILLLLLILSPVLLSAQNWCAVNKKSLNYFLCSKGDYKAIKIKSVQIIGNDTVLYPVKESHYVYTAGWCDYIDTTSIIGMKMSIKPNGINIFYDSAGLEFKIHTMANKGDSWTFFLCKDSSRFLARVDSIYFDQIISGLSDSVKIISLNYVDKDGNTVNHPANNCQIIISKNYGLYQFGNFISISDLKSDYSPLTFSLLGMSQPKIGYQNIDASTIYNFDIGDEIHTKLHYHDYYFHSTTPGHLEINIDTFCIRKIINKLETENAFYYTVSRHQYALYDYYDYLYSETIIKDTSNTEDTINEKYSKVNWDLDRLPYESEIVYSDCVAGGPTFRLEYYENNLNFNTVKTKKNDVGHQAKFQPSMPIDTCKYICTEIGYDYANYYDGLGGPFYLRSHESYYGDPDYLWYEVYELVYFKKGSKEWGTPLVLNVAKDKKQETLFTIAPNPASDRILISIQSNKRIENLIVTDISGKVCSKLNNINSTAYEMDCSYLNEGLYIVSIISGGDVFRKQLLIIR